MQAPKEPPAAGIPAMSSKRPAADGVLLDLRCTDASEQGRRLKAPPDGLGAALVKRNGRYWLQLDAGMLQHYDQLPARPFKGGNPGNVGARRMLQLQESGAVRPLQELMLLACPGAAEAAKRAAMTKALQHLSWGPDPDILGWADTQLAEYDAGDQAQPAGLQGGTLKPYQLAALRFMQDRERGDFRDDTWTAVQALGGQDLWYSPSFGRLSPTQPPGGSCGGILADYMGLGKTVMTLALVAATLDQQDAPTLVVCPSGLVKQWQQEVARWLPGVDCVLVNSKRSLAQQLGGRKGVALVAYNTLQTLVVTGAQLHRVVFDEAHAMGPVRPPSESTLNSVGRALACAAIPATRRWALTGTPITSVHSVHSMLVALRVATFSDWEFGRCMAFGALGSASYFCAQLAACMLRRDKALLQDQLAMELVRHPPQQVQLSAAERRVYDATEQVAAAVYAQGLGLALRRLVAGGSISADVMSSGAWLRSRQLMRLVAGVPEPEAAPPAALPAAAAGPIIDPAVSSMQRCQEDCSICLSEPMRAPQAATPCDHCFCGECLITMMSHSAPRCPLCRRNFRLTDVRISAPLLPPPQLPPQPQPQPQPQPDLGARLQELRAAVDALPADPERDGHVLLSSKPNAIAAKVQELLAADGSAAVLVFSHFADTLRLIGTLLERDDVAFFLGSVATRQDEVSRFQRGEARVMLLPYASRLSSGINLTAANHIVLAEHAVSLGEEGQAIGRAWRIGQKRQVHVWPFEARL